VRGVIKIEGTSGPKKVQPAAKISRRKVYGDTITDLSDGVRVQWRRLLGKLLAVLGR
jgi:hypothetical protein